MNDDRSFELMIRHREIFELLARGATEADWPRLWEQAEQSARAGAMTPGQFNPDGVYRSLANKERTAWKVSPALISKRRQNVT